MPSTGELLLKIHNSQGDPIQNASIAVIGDNRAYTGRTDSMGEARFTLQTPPKEAGYDPSSPLRPYSVFSVRVTAEGYVPVTVLGEQIFPESITVQDIEMPTPEEFPEMSEKRTVIPEHERYVGGMTANQAVTAATYQPEVRYPVVPETITVHLGTPNSSAENVTVPFIDYIKNVASSEIYPTWPESSLRANIIAQVSLALNRIYTEWYRSQGYNFDITSSTAYDQAFVPDRSIFDNISNIVDELFTNYLARDGFVQPLFTEYCDGSSVTCAGMSQWGTVTLARRGYDPLGILQYYYGDDTFIAEAQVQESVPESFAGNLRPGDTNASVATLQRRLDRIAINYPQIPFILKANGLYGDRTEASVRAFQRVFGLNQTGIVDRETWYRVLYVYNAVKKLAELNSEGERIENDSFPRNLSFGDRGTDVLRIQYYLLIISDALSDLSVPQPVITGIYDTATQNTVRGFQRYYGLPVTGNIDEQTWNAVVKYYYDLENTLSTDRRYPGYLIKNGSRGRNVIYIQNALNAIGGRIPGFTTIRVDGAFGNGTESAVRLFQTYYGLTPDGIVGEQTWNKLVKEYNEYAYDDTVG